ncbi:MAG: LPS assembly lipoprotein LptE [Paludibacteraceae bacterium]|nr:LPS assembly lipoprotein LptE [Paludibacteraceae bacterium]
MKKVICFLMTVLLMGLTSCLVSYKFNGSSIDYTKIKTITIVEFPNQAALVYPSLASEFTEALNDEFSQKTRLSFVSRNGDLQIEGAIVDYAVISMSVGTSGQSMDTKLQMTVNVKFTNRINTSESFEERFSASQVFSNTNTINQVQEELNKLIIEDIVNQIFNRTVANW